MTLIIFPVAVPGTLSAAILAFTLSWDGGGLRRFTPPTQAWPVTATPSSLLP
jgi:ABC-type spermidine/putrescine transport system permease subunit II